MNFFCALPGPLRPEWIQYGFMQNALLAILIVAPLFAFLGCLVVNNRMAFFSDAVGHAALTGLAIGALCGLTDPAPAMLAFAVLLAFGISLLHRLTEASTDTVLGLVMSFTVALGVVLLSRGGGFAKYSRYLVGDLLTITHGEIGRLALLGLLLAGGVMLFYNRIFLAFLHKPLAISRGRNVWLIEALFSAAIALSVTLCIPWIGILVVNSLLVMPAAAARNLARNTAAYAWIAALISIVSGVAGLIASFYWGTASGATIVLFLMGFFVLSVLFRRRGN